MTKKFHFLEADSKPEPVAFLHVLKGCHLQERERSRLVARCRRRGLVPPGCLPLPPVAVAPRCRRHRSPTICFCKLGVCILTSWILGSNFKTIGFLLFFLKIIGSARGGGRGYPPAHRPLTPTVPHGREFRFFAGC